MAFREQVGVLMGERLDHERPLWRLDIIPLEGERTGVVGRFHHALADGVTAILLVGGLLWDTAEEKSHSAKGGSSRTAPKPPPDAERTRRRLMRALWRELRPGADSPLDRHIGSDREVAWTSFPLDRLKRIGRAAGEGVTVNDVVLAAVTGALRRWLADSGQSPAALRAQIPVCLHLREQSSGDIGNKDSFLNIDLPIDEPDAARRLAVINAETRERKLDHDADTLYAFFHALGHFKPLYKGVTRVISGPREFALSVSNVPGPRDEVQILGHGVDEFASFAEPADRHALRVSIVSLGGELAFGFCSDPEAVPGVERLAAAVEESMAELEGAG
jgi:WS/DGAT/MGAT family acyltransferase